METERSSSSGNKAGTKSVEQEITDSEMSSTASESVNSESEESSVEIEDGGTLSSDEDSTEKSEEEEVRSCRRKKKRPVALNFKLNKDLRLPAKGPKRSIPIRSLKCTHKDIRGVTKTLHLTNDRFEERKVRFMKEFIKVSLPKISKDCSKWCMLYLKLELYYLSFEKSGYSIKRKDLVNVVEMSKRTKSTIKLRNKEFTEDYNHSMFGIFCVPEYQDRVFLGPFSAKEKHHIAILRRIEGHFIEMSAYDKLLGKKGDTNPIWVYEIRQNPNLNGLYFDITGESVVDITNEDEPEVVIIEADSDSNDDASESLLCPPFAETVTREPSKSINRYILTNIPYLGYFEAHQGDDEAIEVFWGNVGYRFANKKLAEHILEYQLAQIFYPIPQEFEIKVNTLTYTNTEKIPPVNPKYFEKDASYVCGRFGFYEKSSVPVGLLRQHRIESFDDLPKPQANDEAVANIFGLLLMPKKKFEKSPDVESILQWAISEIDTLKKRDEEYQREKRDLQTKGKGENV